MPWPCTQPHVDTRTSIDVSATMKPHIVYSTCDLLSTTTDRPNVITPSSSIAWQSQHRLQATHISLQCLAQSSRTDSVTFPAQQQRIRALTRLFETISTKSSSLPKPSVHTFVSSLTYTRSVRDDAQDVKGPTRKTITHARFLCNVEPAIPAVRPHCH